MTTKKNSFSLKNKTILITGGAGFVGSHLCELFLSKGFEVVIVDVFNSETSDKKHKISNVDHLKKVAKRTFAKISSVGTNQRVDCK